MGLFKKPTEEQKRELISSLEDAASHIEELPESEREYNYAVINAAKMALRAGDVLFATVIITALARANELKDLEDALDNAKNRS